MNWRSLPPAAAVAAAILVCSSSARAERPPIRTLDPLPAVYESDPWRPDVGFPSRTWIGPRPASVEDGSRTQAIARREGWVSTLLRFLRSWLIGGLPR